jgi:Tfp pilus assembly protein PilV
VPKTSRKFSKGFGILEVLISSAIIIVVLGTLVFIAQSSLSNASYMQERAQAVSLAAEAIETVRQNRDSNYIDEANATQWDMIGSASTSSIISGNYFYAGDARTTFKVLDDLLPLNNAAARLRINNGSVQVIKIDGVNYSRIIKFYDISKVGSGQLLTTPVIDENGTNNSKNAFLVSVNVTWQGSGGKAASVDLDEIVANSRFVY